MQDEKICDELILLFAKNFRIKVPLIKTRLTFQGIGNSMTHFMQELDTPYFKEKTLYYNTYVNMTAMFSIISFLLTYRYIP